jgi:hypothetical protein
MCIWNGVAHEDVGFCQPKVSSEQDALLLALQL